MKAILVIDIADDVTEAYEDFTVDYDLRGTPNDDEKVNESIKYIEDVKPRPLPEKKEAYALSYTERAYEFTAKTHPLCADGWNDCIDAITGETE